MTDKGAVVPADSGYAYLVDRVAEWLSERRAEAITFVQQLVRAASLQGHERDVQVMVAEHMRLLGLEVDVWEPDPESLAQDPFFCCARESFEGSPNVVGVWKGQGGGRSLILNGHVDVVPAGDVGAWTHPPWAGETDGSRVYGRGSSDMKGGNVSLLLAVAALRSLGVRLRGDVVVQSVVEEESGGAGTLAAIRRGYRADGAIIPEPTSMRIYPKQQGSVWFRLTVAGRSAHGGLRYEGVSAIDKSIRVMGALRRLERVRNERVDDPMFAGLPIPVPINVGSIRGGEWPSMVPDRVVMEGRLGVIPGETIEAAQAEMEAALAVAAKADSFLAEHPPMVEWIGARWLPGEVDPSSDLVRALVDSYRDVIHEDPVLIAAPGGTDAGLLAAAGGVPGVVFGPGLAETAHREDEYVEIDKVLQAAAVIALTMVRWCGQVEEAGSCG